VEENVNEDEDNNNSSGTSENPNEDGRTGHKASEDGCVGENVRYKPLTPSSSPANGSVSVPQQEIHLVSNF
jgi:hypothetical protein